MKPINLKLTNIGPFCGEHNLDFTELGEMYLICGKMGSGKTTIFDAITYALYGKDLTDYEKEVKILEKIASDLEKEE